MQKELNEIGRFMEREHASGRRVDRIAEAQSAQFCAKLARIGTISAADANEINKEIIFWVFFETC